MTSMLRAILGILVASSVATAIPALAQQSKQADKPLATRDLDVDGIVAEVIESDRKDGVLTVRVRFRNTGDKPAKLLLVRGEVGYRDTYLTAGTNKYFLAKDTSGRELATPRDGGGWVEPTIRPKTTWSWWGKFPAPAEKSYSLYLRIGPPIDGVPIIDK